jgi:integrase
MLASLLESYLLSRELKPSSERWYREVIRLFVQWAGAGDSLTADRVSRFLAAMQTAGRSADYRKSLRNGLVALLRFQGDTGRVRPVKLTALHHTAWTKAEISALLSAVDTVITKPADQQYWRTLIEAAYWSGLSQCDLHNLNRCEVGTDGTVRGERSKTGKPFLTYIPPQLAAHVREGKIWPLRTSREYFRRVFRKITAAAGLRGTFKTLRKSSGTSVERLHPGQGHVHLANSRAIFERHYWFERDAKPLRPEPPLAG